MRDEVTLEARRDIARGEEVTLDYALVSAGSDWRMDCHCGATSCRGTPATGDWQLPAVIEQYRGHCSPFINARLARGRDA